MKTTGDLEPTAFKCRISESSESPVTTNFLCRFSLEVDSTKLKIEVRISKTTGEAELDELMSRWEEECEVDLIYKGCTCAEQFGMGDDREVRHYDLNCPHQDE